MSTSITRVEIRYEQDVVYARQRARQIADLLGFDRIDQTRISTAVSEIARNAYQYGGGGEVEFMLEDTTPSPVFAVTVRDRGPGIKDVQAILEGCYTSHTGMGRGIFGTQRLMDQFHINTEPGKGTEVSLGKILPLTAPAVMPAVLRRIAEALAATDAESPLEEIRRHNQELMDTKEALKKMNNQLYQLATVDALTGISNRRHFDQILEQEWKRMIREKHPLSLILCDIDFFKKYNDRHGHQAGDRCLHAVAQVIFAQADRPGDFAARFGGEEFVVLLPNTPIAGALHMAERIRAAVCALEIEHGDSEADRYVTLSLGVSQMIPPPTLTAADLLHAADMALYQAKKQGRNRTVPEAMEDIPRQCSNRPKAVEISTTGSSFRQGVPGSTEPYAGSILQIEPNI